MMEEKNGRNRRSIRNLMVFPAGQIRLVFAVPVGGLISMLVILQALKGALGMRLTAFITSPNHNAEGLSELVSAVNGIFNLGIIFLALCSILVAAFGIMLTHRYYGPLIPILRSLRAIREGDYTSRVRLRPGDELQDLARVVNEISEKLAPKITP
jgi:nitrogen fixation/metabolism regulation signal transduction histidine kinase